MLVDAYRTHILYSSHCRIQFFGLTQNSIDPSTQNPQLVVLMIRCVLVSLFYSLFKLILGTSSLLDKMELSI